MNHFGPDNIEKRAKAIFSEGSVVILAMILIVAGLVFAFKILVGTLWQDPGDLFLGRCRQLRQIRVALENYRSDFGTFPPRVIRNHSGVAQHSWRVLLLPYLGEKHLYNRFDFDAPWNSSHNIKLINRIPECYKTYGPKSEFTNTVMIYDGADEEFNSRFYLMLSPTDHVTWTEPSDCMKVDCKEMLYDTIAFARERKIRLEIQSAVLQVDANNIIAIPLDDRGPYSINPGVEMGHREVVEAILGSRKGKVFDALIERFRIQ